MSSEVCSAVSQDIRGVWLAPARPRGPSALGRNWGAHPAQPRAGSSCFPALRAKGLYTDKPFAPLTTSVSINKHSVTVTFSLQKAPCGCQYSHTQHILAEIRNQGSQVVQNISTPSHLGFGPRCPQLQMQWDNGSLSLSHHPHTRKPLSALPA